MDDVDGALDRAELMSARVLGCLPAVLAFAALMAVAAPAATAENVLYTADGYAVGVQWAPEYGADPARTEQLAGMLDGLVHGPEMGLLHVSVVTPAAASIICGGGGAIACYGGDRIVLPGDQPATGPPVAYLLAHEYAHHVLAHRRNDPWPATLWGPKRWATAVGVCAGVEQGELLLGYASIPGEAFAETYAMMHFPELHLAWGYTDRLAPDERGEAAARLDVVSPWAGPVTRTSNGHLRHGGTRTLRFRVPLDGRAGLTVTGAPRIAIEVRSGGQVVQRARPRGRVTRASVRICGQRRLHVRLRALAGSGAYSLAVSRP